MFTGIVEEMGKIDKIDFNSADSGCQITIKDAQKVLVDCSLGDSISCNGVCLTVVSFTESTFVVGIAPETLRKTNFADLSVGEKINLERAMSSSTRFGGHFVQGHVDCPVIVDAIVKDPPNSVIFKFKVPQGEIDFMTYIVPKGYVCLDGTSLTVIDVDWASRTFSVMLIAYTQEKVVMMTRKMGDKVNLEVDQMGKYVENTVKGMMMAEGSAVGKLIENCIRKVLSENK
jgi:riboflavin synthase